MKEQKAASRRIIMCRIKVQLQQINQYIEHEIRWLRISCHFERQTNKKWNNETYRERTAFAKIVNNYSWLMGVQRGGTSLEKQWIDKNKTAILMYWHFEFWSYCYWSNSFHRVRLSFLPWLMVIISRDQEGATPLKWWQSSPKKKNVNQISLVSTTDHKLATG